ncbi:MAG: DUF992 domain-containing protein [Fimbriimonadaceae bacterium]|nr:DUF992 domain-containing protein [Alphaproteobacteria bacterium]
MNLEKSVFKINRGLMTNIGLVLTILGATVAPSYADSHAESNTAKDTRLQAGVLVCEGDGGWSAIITSEKTFQCTFSSSSGDVRGEYSAVIRKFGVDFGMRGNTTLTWLVFGSANMVGENYAVGSLEGSYFGVGSDASVGVGLGVNVLAGGGADSFVLQPVSVQVQTGLSISAGVQSLELKYVGSLD